MDKVNQKMKKFNLRGVLDNLRSSVSTPPKGECVEIEETIKSDSFQVAKTVRHGFPFQPTCMAYDPVQNLFAIGTRNGSLRLFGRPGVDVHIRHDNDVAVLQLLFLVNEGAMVSVCADDQLHLWTLRQKTPTIVHSLKFQRERITYCHLPYQSKWLYVGTERGNVHIINIESFVLSGYIINWNKVIELSRKTHPGPVVCLSDNPADPNKLLIGFETGSVALWDLRSKTAETRFSYSVSLKSISWHHEGKSFMCSHSDGSLTTWNIKTPQKPASVLMPHAKLGPDGKPEPCRTISKVEWKSVRNSDPYVIFSGGMPNDKLCRTPCLTVMHGKSTTVLEMEHDVVDFLTLCSTPYINDFQDPFGIVVLLKNDLVVVDLTTPGYPCFENPYPMDIHESPVTACLYFANCPPDLIPAFYSVGSKQKRTGFSEKEWPIRGGEWGTSNLSYPEMLITGHADGSLKFWDASAVTLQVLYKHKTAKLFDKSKCRCPDSDDDPFAIHLLYLCPESRLLVVAGVTHCILLRFSKSEQTAECPVLEVSIVYEIYDETDSPEPAEYPPHPTSNKPNIGNTQSGSVGSYSSTASDGKENTTSVKVKPGTKKWATGYQPDLCCILTWIDGEPPPPITSIQVNSRYGLLAFGNECGLAVVDIIQKTCLLNMGTPDLYGSLDPYSRVPRSPKNKSQGRPGGPDGINQGYSSEECKSPTSDQLWSPLKGLHATSDLNPNVSSLRMYNDPDLETVVEGSTEVSTETVKAPSCERAISVAYEAVEDVVFDPKEDSHSSGGWVTIDDPHGGKMELFDVSDMLPDHIDGEGSRRSSKDSVGKDSLTTSTGSKKKVTVSKSLPLPLTSIEGALDNEDEDPKILLRKAPTLSLDETPSDKSRDQMLAEIAEEHHNNVALDVKSKKERKRSTITAPDPQDLSPTEKRTIERKRKKSIFDHFKSHKNDHDSQHKVKSPSSSDEQPIQRTPPISPTDEVDGKHKAENKGFMRRISQRIRPTLNRTGDGVIENGEALSQVPKSRCLKFEMHDFTGDKDVIRKMSYGEHLLLDKNDGSFSRSRSSSMSSLDNVSKEAIQCLTFADAYTRKTDSFTAPCLWVGTSLGSVLVIVLNLPPEGEQRKTQPVIVSPSGTIFRLKGSILTMKFLDCNGVLIPAISDSWKDHAKEEKKLYSNRWQQSVSTMKARMSPSSSQDVPADKQFAIICSEKQARVVSLPSQICAYKVQITETSIVLKADVISIKDSVCLGCFVANGHIMTFSLPSLKPLLDVDFIVESDLRVAKTFNFSNYGHACYFCSPTEVQKLTVSAEVCENLKDMLGELFQPCEAPEGPKQSFFKNLFMGGPQTLDREELFGESQSGKASRGVAKYSAGTAGMASAQAHAGGAMSEIARARYAAMERGEKLGELDERTERMKLEAENYSKHAHELMQKYKDKKWYQF